MKSSPDVQPSSKMTDAERFRLYRRLLETDFSDFVREAWRVLEPTTPLKWNWHLDLLCETLTAIRKRQIKRQIFNVPPRSMKSILTSVMWPCWCWCTEPSLRFICSSYSADLSVKHSIDRRSVITSDWFQSLWGDRVRLADDQNLKSEFMNTARGVMVAVSTGSAVTGKGCDHLLVDDPHSPLQALSDTERKTALKHFDQTLATRLDDPAMGTITVIMQRLHESDLTGHLLEKEGYEHIALPAVAERYERWKFPISGRVVERKSGDLLWPDRFPQAALDGLKKQLGSYAYAGQYQQNPVPQEGGIFKRNWFRTYTQAPTDFRQIIFSVDSAFKTGEGNDFTSCTIWGSTESAHYLLSELHERLELPDLKRKLVELAEIYCPHDILVEDHASGQSLIQELRSATTLPIRPFKADRDKIARAHSVTPLVEAGNVFVPDPATASWCTDYLDELTIFPSGQFDDRVDSTTQFLNHVRSPRESGIFAFYREAATA